MKNFLGYLRFLLSLATVLDFSIERSVVSLFRKDKDKAYRDAIPRSVSTLIRRLGSTMKYSGAENLDPNKVYILMPNHQSYTDIILIFLAMGLENRKVTFMSKKEMFYVPFLGIAMRGIGCVSVDRGNTQKALASITDTVKRIKSGLDIVIFPEGTRSKDRALQPFKRGGFLLARKAGVEILPVAIKGTDILMHKSSIKMFPANLELEFLKPIETDGKKDAQLIEEVETALANALTGYYK